MPLDPGRPQLIGGIAFLVVGLRGYWDYAGWWAIGVLLGTMALGDRCGSAAQPLEGTGPFSSAR